MRCRVASSVIVAAALLALDRFTKERLAAATSACAQPEIDRPAAGQRHDTGSAFASDLDVRSHRPAMSGRPPGKPAPAFLELRGVALHQRMIVVCAIEGRARHHLHQVAQTEL